MGTAGLQWLVSACIFDPQKELRLGFVRFLLALRFLQSPGCVCVFHMRTHCQRHGPQVVPSSLSSFACHPAVTLPAAPTLQPHSPSCEEGRKEGGPKCRVRWEPLKSSVPRTVASARTAHRLICKSIREVPRTIWRKTAPFLPGQSQRQSRDHSGIM